MPPSASSSQIPTRPKTKSKKRTDQARKGQPIPSNQIASMSDEDIASPQAKRRRTRSTSKSPSSPGSRKRAWKGKRNESEEEEADVGEDGEDEVQEEEEDVDDRERSKASRTKRTRQRGGPLELSPSTPSSDDRQPGSGGGAKAPSGSKKGKTRPKNLARSSRTPSPSASEQDSIVSDDEEPSSETEDEAISSETEEQLKSESESKSYTKFSFEDPSCNAPIQLGDVIEIAGSKDDRDQQYKISKGWLGVVEEIRALKGDVSNLSDPITRQPALKDGKQQKKVDELYIKVGWLYSKKDFRDLADIDEAFRLQCQVMGPNERVKSDHIDWHRQANIVRNPRPELVYLFDDCYPAPNASGQTSLHPLHFYSTPKLQELSTSPYSIPAFSTIRQSDPPESARVPIPDGGDLSTDFILPFYYFGVTSLSSLPATSRTRRSFAYTNREPFNEEKYANGLNIKDGVQEPTYVRTAFSWKERGPIGDSDDDDDEVASKGKRSARKNKPRPKKKKGEKLWPLSFSLHSDPPKPYNPTSIQHYSRQSQQWWDLDDLEHSRSYRVKQEDMEDQQPAPQRVQSRADAVLAQALLEDDDSDSEPEPSQREPENEGSDLSSKILNLSRSPIVRGGSYGLTGNCYLVARSEWLAHYYEPSQPPLLPCPSDLDSAPTDTEWMEKAKEVVDVYEQWEEGVRQRQEREGEGNGLKLAWAESEETKFFRRIRRDSGYDSEVEIEWVCPKTGEAI
ncbi:uncharacterized protein JCM6883_000135 [Sporobolomyces salmoneus]|uniref:uncharacterized protein n=1 Tax=Sporobolomyces salmoneus TaxID=183962 RepID=UPI0031755570